MRLLSRMVAITLGLMMCGVVQAEGAPAFTDPDKSVMVKPGEKTVTLFLKSNATTGYRWFFQSSHPRWIKAIKRKYIAPNTKMVGAPGIEEWTFNVPNLSNNVPSVGEINMRYARPWDIKASKPTTFYVVFTGK